MNSVWSELCRYNSITLRSVSMTGRFDAGKDAIGDCIEGLSDTVWSPWLISDNGRLLFSLMQALAGLPEVGLEGRDVSETGKPDESLQPLMNRQAGKCSDRCCAGRRSAIFAAPSCWLKEEGSQLLQFLVLLLFWGHRWWGGRSLPGWRAAEPMLLVSVCHLFPPVTAGPPF